MEQSNVIDQLHKLKVAAEYSVLLTKLRLLDEMSQHRDVLCKSDFIESCNKKNILYTDTDGATDNPYEQVVVYYKPEDDNGRFIQVLTIITCKRMDILPDDIDHDLDNITMVSEEYCNNIAEKLCDRLNEMEDEYKDVLAMFT